MRFAVLIILLTGCTQFPQLDALESAEVANAAYPELLPLDRLLDAPEISASPELRAGIESRVGALRSRAALLKTPVVDAGTRARMRRGISAPF